MKYCGKLLDVEVRNIFKKKVLNMPPFWKLKTKIMHYNIVNYNFYLGWVKINKESKSRWNYN